MGDATQKHESTASRIAKARGDPTEPPFADAHLPERQKVATEVYSHVSAKAKGTKLFCSKPEREVAKAPPYRTGWIADDPKYHPYSYFESSNNEATPLPKRSGLPPEIWFPRCTGQEEPKSEPSKSDPASPGSAGSEKVRRASKSGSLSPSASPPGSPSHGGTRATGLLGQLAKSRDAPDATATVTAKPVELTPWVETGKSLRLKPRKSALPLAARPRWHTEHHIKFSKGNHELNPGYREYFDKPVKQEGDGIPRLYEQYAMNDRQTRWHDEPAELGEYRRTLFDWIAPTNVSGPKSQQLTSYWRGRGKLCGASDGDAVQQGKDQLRRSVSLPAVGKVRQPEEENKLRQEMLGKSSSSATSSEQGRSGRRSSRASVHDPAGGAAKGSSSKTSQADKSEQGLAELCRCVSDMPADDAVKFWRDWSQYSKMRIKPKEIVADKAKPRRGRQRLLDNRNPASGGESPPTSPGNLSSRGPSPPMSPMPTKRSKGRKKWDNRWNVLVSKNNEEIHEAYQQYFTTAEYHSGKQYGHPSFYLAAPNHKWKSMRHNVVLSPTRGCGKSPFQEPQRLSPSAP